MFQIIVSVSLIASGVTASYLVGIIPLSLIPFSASNLAALLLAISSADNASAGADKSRSAGTTVGTENAEGFGAAIKRFFRDLCFFCSFRIYLNSGTHSTGKIDTLDIGSFSSSRF